MKKLIPILILALLLGCAPVRVQYDYDNRAAFSNYRTYNFFPELQTGLTDLDQRRLLAAVENALRNRGFSLSEDPGLFLNIYSNIYEDPSQSTVGVGMGGTGGDVGGGVSVGIPLSSGQLQREIIFEFLDAGHGQTIWQAVSDDRFNQGASPERREDRFQAIAVKVFKGFPPK